MSKEEEKNETPSKRERVPIQDLMAIKETMNDLFSDLFTGKQIRSLPSGKEWVPFIDIYETKETIGILVDIPGMKPKDVEIIATPNQLIIKGERRPEKDVKQEEYILQEHYYGHFTRTIELPYPVKPKEIKALYKDGTLEIKLPKSRRGKSVKVDID